MDHKNGVTLLYVSNTLQGQQTADIGDNCLTSAQLEGNRHLVVSVVGKMVFCLRVCTSSVAV
jgi:hypothetical protein